MSNCYRCGKELPSDQTECPGGCRNGQRSPATPEEFLKMLGVEFCPIDWDKIAAMPDAEKLDAMLKILKTAIPGVQRGSPQYFAIMPLLKLS